MFCCRGARFIVQLVLWTLAKAHVSQAFFLLQALHGIKPSRVTSNVADSQLLITKNQHQAKSPNHRASDTNPPGQDWRPSRKRATTRATSESAGRQASPNKKPIKTVQLYKSRRILARYQDETKKNNRPRRSKTCRNWPIKDNRHHPASMRPARNGYPQDRPPQI